MNRLNRWNKKALDLLSVKGEALAVGRTRLKIVRSISLFLFVLIIVRMADLMIIQANPDMDNPIFRAGDNAPVFERADIVDRNGVLLATTLQVPSLYADPSLIENKPYIAKQLEDILGVENILPKLERKTRFVWVKRGLTPDEHYAVNALGSPGLAFRTETKRFYPQGRTGAHLIGYSSVDGKGLAGMELQYQEMLDKGQDPLVLNMDIRVQYALTKSLRHQMKKFKAKAAFGGVVDVETGEVIAAVSLPDFDPHHIGDSTGNERFNRFAMGVYEMGSTFKLFSTAAYIEETGKPFSQTFDARKPLEEGRYTINDYHAEKRILTLPEVFIHSSNIGSALMGRTVGTKGLQDFYRDLGLMDKVDTDFPAKGSPLLPSPWRDINTLTASYGHGIAVSPLHVLLATATIANGGVQPQLSFAKTEKQAHALDVKRRILSPSTAYKMRQLLRLNVTDGSGKQAEVAGYYVGGKTGTSEKLTNGKYDKTKSLSSFVGVFPAHEPKYAVLAILDEPQGIKETYGYATGGWVGAPVVGEVVQAMGQILAIPPVDNAPNLTGNLSKYLKDGHGDSGYSPINYSQ